MLMTVWSKGSAKVFYDTSSGYFTASEEGWWGPDDFTLVGIYALIQPDETFANFSISIMNNIPEEYQSNVQEQPTDTDLFWVYLGNHNYFALTGKMGEPNIVDEMLSDMKGGTWYVKDEKRMEKLIDEILVELSSGKSNEQLAEDSKRKDEWLEIFVDRFMNELEWELEPENNLE